MRIVTTHAQVISLFAVPVSGPSTMYTVSPVPVLRTVTLAAEKVRVLEINKFAVAQRQEVVSIIRVVAVQTPDSHTSMEQFHVPMDEQIFPPFEIHGKVLLRSVACPTRSNGLRKWR
jgi:hypothetical protein